MADEKQAPQDDDWLAEFEQEGDSNGLDQLDQANIDQLLGGTGVGADSGEQSSGGEKSAENSVELDQAALDALLEGSIEKSAAEEDSWDSFTSENSSEDGSVELDQATLDSLLTGPEGTDSTDLFATGDRSDFDQENYGSTLDQASLDALFGSDDEDFQAALESDNDVPSQSDIDELFAQVQDNGEPIASSPEDDSELQELFSSTRQTDEEELETAGFELEDTVTSGSVFGSQPKRGATLDENLDEDIFGEEDETVAFPPPAGGDGWLKILPGRLQNSSRYLAGALLAAVLLLGGSVYFTTNHGSAPVPEDTDILPQFTLAVPAQEPPSTQPPAQPPTQSPVQLAELAPPPVAKEAIFKMPEGGGEVSLLLPVEEWGSDVLSYEVTTQPVHGRLAGDLPTPIYLPNNNFPGRDQLEFRVKDGQRYSEPAIILITGPDLRQVVEKEPAAPPGLITPKEPFLQANDITIKIISTRELIIDWRKIWQQANHQPFGEDVTIEVVSGNLSGRLTEIDSWRHRYLPERLFSGNETIGYRFKKGSTSSKVAELRVVVELGDHPPEIKIRGLEDRSYQVGDIVVLDASGTKDEEPESLLFEWRQMAGTPVRLEQLNAEGSVVSLVVPSFFYTVEDPGPVLQLTVTDRAGQSDDRVFKIGTSSRRQSALWLGRTD